MYPPMHAHTFRIICAVNSRMIKVLVHPGHTISDYTKFLNLEGNVLSFINTAFHIYLM
jgi:hypothetical protein